jgi:hypothetical protein
MNKFATMNTLRNGLLVSLFGLALAVTPVLRAAESPAQDALVKSAAGPRPDTSGESDARKATVSPPQDFAKGKKGSGGAAEVIPILLIVFGCPVLIVGLVAYFRARKQKHLHDTLRLMIEKGVPIPPELLRPPITAGEISEADKNDDPRTALRQGLFLIALGLGVCIWLWIGSSNSWGLGFIPLLIGLSFLAEWRIESAKPSNSK